LHFYIAKVINSFLFLQCIEFHENGKRHKENVQKRLKDIHKKNKSSEKKEKKLENDMKLIEEVRYTLSFLRIY